ncbi:hypothetical protein [Telmatospirillum siberiense]|uniref:DUF4231 domain-containing protein n=1 Tax=Telmatospirillum siberiense TaxID=382514 RepID=A0A2N3PRB1_9PROT|nr:hypothetical protein [Telmatospirillum siberiense]PKU22943.1 hypothetical protein CWS72_19000 [Telmatospirillum siberiense]
MQGYDEHSIEEYEPSRRDLEDQIGRNEAYIHELELVHDHLRSIAMYWYFAANLSMIVAIGLGFLLFAQGRAFDWLVPTTTVGQTIVTALLSLIICAAVSSFFKFVSLRRLAAEATEVAEANRAVVHGAIRLFEEIV